jgi:prepilin-type N-terminal cleavage/methylation domain-containing protein
MPMRRLTAARQDRAGFTILELMIALGLMAVFCAFFVPALASVSRERRLSMQEHVAMQHAANVLESLTQRAFAELSAGQTTVPAPPNVRQVLPAAEQTVTIAPVVNEPAAMKVTVELRWQQAGRWSRPVTLSAWLHAREGGGS